MKFPKETKSPEKGWKSSLAFGVSITPRKIPKPIRPVGKRTAERIKEHGSEKELFALVWSERPHVCENCGKVLREARAHNFDHTVPKGRDQSKRYDPENIRLLCFGCHFEKTTGMKYK